MGFTIYESKNDAKGVIANKKPIFIRQFSVKEKKNFLDSSASASGYAKQEVLEIATQKILKQIERSKEKSQFAVISKLKVKSHERDKEVTTDLKNMFAMGDTYALLKLNLEATVEYY